MAGINKTGTERTKALRMEQISLTKKQFRTKLLAKRNTLSADYCDMSDRLIRRNLKSLPEYRRSQVIFVYVSTENEVDTRHLIAEALEEGKHVAVPRCERGKPGMMEACEIHSMSDLEPGTWGIPEPKTGCRKVEPEEIDLCVIPCISMTESGIRLGYGGGYYDRYLERIRERAHAQTECSRERQDHILGRISAFCAAICRQQMISDDLPAQPHDRPVDALITEKQVILYENAK